MSRRPKGNDASRYRALTRDLRSRKGIVQAKSALRSIEDPYFRSLSYLAVAVYGAKTKSERKPLIEKMLEESQKAEPLWRRGELFSLLLKDTRDLREGFPAMIESSILDQLREFEMGQGLSEALVKIAKFNSCSMTMGLIDIALSNDPEFSVKDTKVIIKNWARRCRKFGPNPDEIMIRLMEVVDIQDRAELLGYLHLQLFKNDPKMDISHIFASSLSASMEMEGADRMKMISYLSKHAHTAKALEMLVESIDQFEEAHERIKITAYVSSGADRSGDSELANELIDRAVQDLSSIEDEKVRNGIQLGISQDLLRLGRKEQAEDLLKDLIKKLPEDDPISSMAGNILEGSSRKKKQTVVEDSKKVERSDGKRRHILALYDTYEGSIKQVHLRAVARAAPLCYGFDLDLALIGFPEKDLDKLIEKTKKETNVGQGGRYLSMLHGEGRIHLIKASKAEPPTNWDKVGLPVATTSKPDPGKAMHMSGAVKIAEKKHPRKVVCLIMGLGRQGLPRSLLSSVPLHLELTGKNVPLETATAMGIMVQQLSDRS
jgi:hypothetical protein